MSFPNGLGTALITPFHTDYTIDYEALDRILDQQLASEVDYIVVLGTTGEPATMTDEEKKAVRDFVIRKVNGRKPLVLGYGGNNTRLLCEQLRGEDLSGFAAILSVCPYYNKPNQEGLYRHFVEVAKASPIPVILYNVPGRTGVNMLPQTAIRIYEAMPDQILGIKEASGNEEQIAELIALAKGTNLHVISGDDGLCYQLMQLGACGLISVASNAFPQDFATLVHEHKAWIQAKHEEMISLLFREGSPVGVKEVLRQQGLCQNTVRLPLAPASQSLSDDIAAQL